MRLRKGYGTREVSALTGWAPSTIQDFTTDVEAVLFKALKGKFYQWPCKEQQVSACQGYEEYLAMPRERTSEIRYPF
jgi:hypothetical protein